MRGKWIRQKIRDAIVDYVKYWKNRAGFPDGFFLSRLGIARRRIADWRERYGLPNRHNGHVPRVGQLDEWEKDYIIDYYLSHPLDGYRRVAYMMIDENSVVASPPTVYRVLRKAGVLRKWNDKTSKKGDGFDQPTRPHEHWHTDVSYINVNGTFYYLCAILDGYSRYIVHWEIREKMETLDIQIIEQRALEKFSGVEPRLITDNGPQFISKEFKKFIKISGMTHVKTSPFYPQSNGKIERFHGSLKRECIRPKTPLTLEDARRATEKYVEHYNNVRLHSAVKYVTPKDKLEGREAEILETRKRRLKEARERRKSEFRKCA